MPRVNDKALTAVAERLLRMADGPGKRKIDWDHKPTASERKVHEAYARSLDRRYAREPHTFISKKELTEMAERLLRRKGDK